MSMAEESLPKWKRELIERRRATPVDPSQLTCSGVRHSESQQGMHLPSTVPDIQQLITQIEAEKKSKMGEEKTKKVRTGTVGGDDDNHSDSSEEFKYGPGIVSKLKNKYLSLTLRESRAKVRPSLACMRRATSLENILDEEKPEESKQPKFIKNASAAPVNIPIQSRRGLSRNKENMKRARSVEALMRYRRLSSDSSNGFMDDFVDVDNEKGRNRASLEEQELPPPDLVKQTLKLFEPISPAVKPPPPPKTTLGIKAVTTKPTISPKPVVVEAKKEDHISTVHSDLRVETKARLRPLDIGHTSPDSPRSLTATSKYPFDVINKKNKLSQEKTVISVQKSDEIDLYREKPTLIKDWSPASNERSEVKDSSPILLEKSIPTVERIPDIIGLFSPSRERPPFFHDKSPPIRDFKGARENENEKYTTPSPKPRIYSRVPDKKPAQAPPPPPEPQQPLSPKILRSVSEAITSPASPQMKQVGVIRPIVTQKSPPQLIQKSVITDRESEKNLKNKVKLVEQPVTKVIVSLKQSPEECTVASPKTQEEKKTGSWSQKPNTMVFNFSHRKNVPDYIENDGLILGKRERPKVRDSGVILLPGGTDDSSTDFDSEEGTLDPPSPCDFIFIGDNVLINGKSNLQKAPKRTKMHIKFNEEAPKLFEYPSEASLLDDLTLDNSAGNSSPGLNLALKSSSLSSYTPSKLAIGSDFQLGVTRSQPPPPPSSRHSEPLSSDEEDYLRPADDASTVAWSAETATDLLF